MSKMGGAHCYPWNWCVWSQVNHCVPRSQKS
jgi:hypothetical protein